MKKIFLSLTAAFCMNANAQFTITSAMAPVVGDVDSSVPTLSTGLTTPSSGTNQFWNYAGVVLNPTATPQSSTYTPVSSAPNASLFPNATIASTGDNVSYSMSKISSTLWEELGTATPTTSDCIVYSNPLSYISIPFSYGSTHNDTHAYATANSTLTGNTSTSGNGTGTLALPGITFNNVLKVSITQNQIETSSFGTATININFHAFFGSASKFPLFSVMNFTYTSSTFSVASASGHINKLFVAGIKENSFKESLSIYPNPAAGNRATIKNLTGQSFEVEIYDATGSRVNVSKIDENPEGSLNIENLKPGIYFVHLKNREGALIKKLIIQ